MRNTLLLAALALAVSSAHAAPYFRVINPAHPEPVVGALIDPAHIDESEATSLLPIFTHSPADGCLLPSIVCEEWTPLAVGASINSGKVTFDVAPLANVLPWMQNGLAAVIPAGWAWAHKVLAAGGDNTDPITFSAGPVWEYSQLRNKGSFKIFTGLALHF